MASAQLESGADIGTPIVIFPETFNAVLGLDSDGISNFWHEIGHFYYGEDYKPPAKMRDRSIFDEWKRKQIAQAKKHRANKGNIRRRYATTTPTTPPTTTPTTPPTTTTTTTTTTTPTTDSPTVLPVTVLRNNNDKPVTVSRAHARTERNGDSESEEGIGKRTDDFKSAFTKDADAIFSDEFDTVAICRVITGDMKSDRRWRQLTRSKGEEAVRMTIRDCWAEWREYGDPENKGAVLNARLAGLANATATESEVA